MEMLDEMIIQISCKIETEHTVFIILDGVTFKTANC